MNTLNRAILSAIVSICIGLCGCDRKPGEVHVYLATTTNWVSLERVLEQSNELVRRRLGGGSLDRFEVTVNVHERSSTNLLDVVYFENYTFPEYLVAFDLQGHVSEITNWIATEKFSYSKETLDLINSRSNGLKPVGPNRGSSAVTETEASH